MQHVRIAVCSLVLTFSFSPLSVGQAAPTGVSTSANNGELQAVLAQIDDASQTTNVDVARLRIEKWKTDGQTKQQAQADAASIERNLSAALPSLVSQARGNPNDVVVLFQLYRNIGALYDVLSSVAEETGAFGAKQEYQTLGQHVQQFESARRGLGDVIEQTARRQGAELTAMRNANATSSRVASAPPKKIIVDNSATAPAAKKKNAKKRKPATSAQPSSSDQTTNPK